MIGGEWKKQRIDAGAFVSELAKIANAYQENNGGEGGTRTHVDANRNQ